MVARSKEKIHIHFLFMFGVKGIGTCSRRTPGLLMETSCWTSADLALDMVWSHVRATSTTNQYEMMIEMH